MMTTNTTTTWRPHRRGRPMVIGAVAVWAGAACAGGDDAGPTASTTTPSTVTSIAAVSGAPPTAATAPATGEPGATQPATTQPAATALPGDPAECPTAALPGDGPPVEIEFWHAMSATTGVIMEGLVADYNASQDGVHVTPLYQGGYTETFTKYVNTLRSQGDLPAIVQLSEISLQQMVDSRSIVPVGDCIAASGYDLSDYPSILLDQYRIGGELVTMPFQLANPVLFYDGNDFVAAGLDPDDPPSTLDELATVSQTLVDAGVVESGIALEVDTWSFEQWVATSGAALVDNDNGRSGRALHASLDSDAVAGVLARLRGMHDAGTLLITGRGGEQSGLARFIAVAQGKASMTIASSASLGEIYEQLYRVPDVDLRVGPFPSAGAGKTTIGGGSLYLTNDSGDVERAAAWDLMTWLNEPAQQVRWSVGTGYVPTRISAVDDPALQALWRDRPGFRVAHDQLVAPGVIPGGAGPVIGDYAGVRDAIEDGLESLYAGADPVTVQTEMQAAADAAIDDYNRRIGG